MNKFSTNVCPLCDKVTHFRKVNDTPTFECRQGHYQVELNKDDTNQNVYIDNWCLVNYANANKSHVYQLHGENWKFLTEIPLVYAIEESAIRARLNKLTATL